MEPGLLDEVKFFGRHKGGALRDAVLLSVEQQPSSGLALPWSCDSDAVTVIMDADAERSP